MSAQRLPTSVARGLGFAGLGAFGALHWAGMVEPADSDAVLAGLLAALAGAVVLGIVAARGAGRGARAGTTAVVGAALLVAALLAAGVPDELLAPRGWDELSAGIGQGLSTVPSVRIPYAGLDEWTRTVLVLGGGVLLGLGALLAFAPRRGGRLGFPVPAAMALGTLYAVPAVQREADSPFLAGLAFALLLAAFLWLERVERRGAPLALGLVTAAGLLALVLAPRLDGSRALLDYEELAQSLSPAASTRYDWNHRYGPLNWPRDGREVLRVRAPRRSYWKAATLTSFDGLRWVSDVPESGAQDDIAVPAGHRAWVHRIQVTLRALRSTQFVAAGTTLAILRSPRLAMETAPGVFQTSRRPLRRGHAYRALVYTPRPTTRQLGSAGSDYPEILRRDYTTMLLPAEGRAPVAATRGDPRVQGADKLVVFPRWGEAGEALVHRRGAGPESAAPTLRDSAYARTYALARRLRASSATPLEFVRAVERYLARGFEYSETPPRRAVPLESFLFEDRVGYCQQFSGAMALLLRMGGLPARVAAGFSPGSRDGRRDEYVVRDVDAHSWVEVYFPGIGWVTRDPTPPGAPARSQIADLAGAGAASDATLGVGSERALDQRPGAAGARVALEEAPADGRSVPGGAIAAGVAGALAAGALLVLGLRRRRRRPRSAADGLDPALVELRRALRRSGRPLRPDTTLEAIARGFGGSPAEGYVRELLAARYGYGNGGPTRAQRAALRHELAAGLGLGGRLRAWWALPPRV